MTAKRKKNAPKNTIADFIAAELTARIDRNPKYSMRAFARDIELPPSTLSRIIANKREPSPKMALAILDLLELNTDEADDYRSILLGNKKTKKKVKRGHTIPQKLLTPEEFSRICSWHSMAVLEILRIPGMDGTPEWLAMALKTTKKKINEIANNLEDLGFVRRENGRVIGGHSDVFYKGSSTSDPYILQYFKEVVKYMQVVPEQTDNKFHFVAESLAVRKQDLPKIAAMLKPFSDRVRRECTRVENTDSLYQLISCVFPIYTK